MNVRTPWAAVMTATALIWITGCPPGSQPQGPGKGDAGVDAGVPAAITCIWPTQALAGVDSLPVSIYGAHIDPNAVARWNGAPRPTAVIDAGFAVVTLTSDDLKAAGAGTLDLINPAADASVASTLAIALPAARRRIQVDGLYTQFERRGFPNGYYSGQLLQMWSGVDPYTGLVPAADTSLQLDAVQQMGVNTITFELRAADGGLGAFVPPVCPMNSALGLQYPQPQPLELANLRALLDLVASKGMKVWLRLPNTYMDENPPVNNGTWLTAALGAIKGHPALDVVLFEGSPHVVNGQCGLPAEPPLWNGANSVTGNYVRWAMALALDAGFPARQLSAEEIVGGYVLLHSPNLQDPLVVMKQIFDQLGVPPDQRTYAISMYEQNRCDATGGATCVDERDDLWADQTLQHVWDVVGHCSGARVIAPEMGVTQPYDGGWRAEWAVENLGALFERYGVEGGSYWLWTNFQTSDDTDPTKPPAVKYRGVAFNYSAVQAEIADLGGSHLAPIPNGSFERGDGGVNDWTVLGLHGGSGARLQLSAEPGQPEVMTRGQWALRLSTGADPNGAAIAQSAVLPVTGDAGYVVTTLLRFSFSGDPDAGAPGPRRPQVRVSLLYFAADGGAASGSRQDVRLFQESSTPDFKTFPFSFVTPLDATAAQIELAVEAHGLPMPLTADFDVVR